MKMNKRVYGVVGIRSIMSNWNADFTGHPKSTSSGDFFGSDKAFKFPIKKMWQAQGEKVIYVRSYKIDDKAKKDKDATLQPQDLNEQYAKVFDTVLDAKTSSKEVLKNLFSAIDIMNFGATFAEKGQNISITGAVQIGQGFNKYEGMNVEIQDILSPFRNSNKEEADASSLGKKIMANEAHYFYPFAVNPANYNDYVALDIEGFEGYTAEAFEKFKKGCLVAATAFNTNSKVGCENEFALFITCKEDSNLYLANIDSYIDFRKENGQNFIDLTKVDKLLTNKLDQIENIEIYYNDIDTTLELGGLKCSVNSLY